MKNEKQTGYARRDFALKSMLGLGGLAVASTAKAASTNLDKAGNSLTLPNNKRKLGDLEVSAIGLGCMSMKSGSYNPPRDKKEMIPVIRGAVDLGVTFLILRRCTALLLMKNW